MASKLAIYNASLSENREPRRLLDDAWGDGSTTGAVKYCLEIGQWTFATRTIQLDASPSVEPAFGYRYAFDQPVDMVDVCGIYQDERCGIPLLLYADERHFWYSDLDPIFVSYVSNHADYGADLSLWPESFVKLMEAYLANEIVGNLTGAESDRVSKVLERARTVAKSGDAMRKPTKFMPPGSWTIARHYGWRGDRGNRSRLTG